MKRNIGTPQYSSPNRIESTISFQDRFCLSCTHCHTRTAKNRKINPAHKSVHKLRHNRCL